MQIDNFFENLSRAVQDPLVHARFLNTLSLMELSGAHKLSRLISRRISVSNFLLEHVSEEYRHAFFLRRLAHKLSNGTIDSYADDHVFCKRSSINYINLLDRKILLALRKHGFCQKNQRPYFAYLLTTLVIEERALPFYERYQAILDNLKPTMSVKSVVSEEQHHLQEIGHCVSRENFPKELIHECYAIEAHTYGNWIASLSEEIQKRSMHH